METDVIETIKAAATACYPNEACGYIVNIGKKALAIQCMNTSTTPRNHFMIPPRETDRCRALGEIVGVWHTHVEESSQPSAGDRGGCEMTGIPWHILAIYKESLGYRFEGPTLIEPTGFVMDYIGRPYVAGVYDCYSLLQDFYAREFDIRLSQYERGTHTFANGKNQILDNFKSEGFVALEQGAELKRGDVLVIQSGTRVPDHIGIYLGGDLMLHHCRERISRRDVFAGHWRKHTARILRHKSKC